jgi:hypothetical protein
MVRWRVLGFEKPARLWRDTIFVFQVFGPLILHQISGPPEAIKIKTARQAVTNPAVFG